MGEEQRQTLAGLFADDSMFKDAIMSATSLDDAVRIARERGIDATTEDFAAFAHGDLSDAELEGAAGGLQATNGNGTMSDYIFCVGC